ncbi:MAG: Bug family tripartite tricarboxylate transporter substrate binding protein [Burkholderiales bacterium]
MKKLLLSLGALTMLAVCASAPHAQTFPAKPIRVVIPNEPGTLDFYIRMMEPRLREITGQPWIVEYRAGAGGQIGASTVAKAAPDGYTIMFTHPGTHATVQYLSKTVLYDPVNDFTPITALAASWLCLLANPSLPANSIQELLELAKKSPGKLSYSHNGVGNTTHMSGEQLKIITGMDMLQVAYKGGAPALAAVVADQVPLSIVSIAGGALPQIKAGKVKILAMIGSKRYPGLPNVPNMPEVVAGFEPPPTWIAFFGPAKMPKPVLDRIYGALVGTLKDQDLRDKVEATGVAVMLNTPEEFAALQKRDIASVGRVVKAAGIQAE